jgi:hypothetical protein
MVALCQTNVSVMSETAYRQLLNEYATTVQKPLTPVDAARLKRRFEQATTVVDADGNPIAVDNRAVLKTLTEASQKTRSGRIAPEARTQAVVLNSLNRPKSDATSADPERLAEQILREKEFRDASVPKSAKNWWEEWQEKIQKAIDDFLRSLSRNGPAWNWGGGEWFARIVQGTLILFAVFVVVIGLYYLIRWAGTLRPAFRRRTDLISGLDLLEKDLPDPLVAARQSAAQGDYRSALRLAYIAALRQLATNGLLVLQENKTNWEYQRDLNRRSTTAYNTLLPATRLFDVVWYGQRPATRTEYEAVVAAHDALTTLHADNRSTTEKAA